MRIDYRDPKPRYRDPKWWAWTIGTLYVWFLIVDNFGSFQW